MHTISPRHYSHTGHTVLQVGEHVRQRAPCEHPFQVSKGMQGLYSLCLLANPARVDA